MSTIMFFVPDLIRSRINVGAYERPFSGVGIEFDPLGVKPGRTGITLHETGYLPANAQWNFPGTFSPFWRLIYNGSRGHCILIGERVIELTPAHIMLIPQHCFFHSLGANPVPTFWMTFSFIRHLHADQAIPALLPPRDTELCLIRDLRELISANATWEPNDAIYRNSLALLQVVLARPELRWQPPLPEKFVRVRQFIQEEFSMELTTPMLARRAGVSVPSFIRGFKEHFGVTPGRYVTETRVREAAHLLLQTDEPIEAIAEQTGFPNRAHFSRVFKRVTEESPAGFRCKHRIKDSQG